MSNPFESPELEPIDFKTTKEQLVLRIMQHAMNLQNKYGLCTFIEWSGHVQTLRVSIRDSIDDYKSIKTSGEVQIEVPSYIETLDGKEAVAEYEMGIIKSLEFMQKQLDYMERAEFEKHIIKKKEKEQAV